MRVSRILALALLTIASAGSAYSGTLPPQPIPSHPWHNAAINRIALLQSGRVFAFSDDKSWSSFAIGGNSPAKRFWMPYGSTNEGQAYAGVASSQGTLVAVSGWTGIEREGLPSIFIYGLPRGDLIRRIRRVPGIVYHLLLSPDERHLIGLLGGGQGVRVWRVSDGEQIAQDSDYTDRSTGGCVMHDGRLFTVAFDGQVRGYDRNYKRTNKVRLPLRPYSLSCSPDGKRIAVGYFDTSRVDLLDADSLGKVRSLELSGSGNLAAVAWSADGKTLYAGGTFQRGEGAEFLAWNVEDKVDAKVLSYSSHSINDIRTAGGMVVYATSGGELCLFKHGAKDSSCRQPESADFRQIGRAFRVSGDGLTVAFRWDHHEEQKNDEKTVRFSLAKRLLTSELVSRDREVANRNNYASSTKGGFFSFFKTREDKQSDKPEKFEPADGLFEATISGFELGEWKNRSTFLLNNHAVKLDEGENARSAAGNQSDLLLGGDWSLRLFGRNGGQIWRANLPAPAWGVNIARNRPIAVAALGDGTIRWYRLKDGHELLALLPNRATGRWVAWTPQGYYIASAGGEDSVAWLVDRGLDQAPEMYPASRFRASNNRPEVVDAVLETLDEQLALEKVTADKARAAIVPIEQRLPPVVTLGNTEKIETGSRKVVLNYTASTSSDAPVTALRVLVDGREIKRVKMAEGKGKNKGQKILSGSIDVELPSGDAVIALMAENRFGAGMPVTTNVHWLGACRT